MNRIPTSRPTSQCVGEWNATDHAPAAKTRAEPGDVGSPRSLVDGEPDGQLRRRPDQEQDAFPSPDGDRKPHPRRTPSVDPAARCSACRSISSSSRLDQFDQRARTRASEVGVSRVNRGLDPVEARLPALRRDFPQLPRLPPGPAVRCAGRAPKPALERFPREESDHRKEITQPAPPHGGGLASAHPRRPLPRGRSYRRRRDGRGLPRPRRRARRVRSRSRSCTGRSQATPASSNGSGARPARPRGSRTRTSSTSTTGVRWTACTTWSWSSSAARASGDILNAAGPIAPAQAAEILRQTLSALGPRAHARHRASRRQARERPGDARRRREGRGLRPGARVRRRADHARPGGHGHGAVPRARADPGRAGGSAHRPVLARHRGLRAPHREAPVHRRDADGDRLQAHPRARARSVVGSAGSARRAGRLRRGGDGPRPGAPAGVRRRDADGPGRPRAPAATGAEALVAGRRHPVRHRGGRRDDGGRRASRHGDPPDGTASEASAVPQALRRRGGARCPPDRRGLGSVDVRDPPYGRDPRARRRTGRPCRRSSDDARLRGPGRRR